ncbi:Uncharacterized protein APZ42_026480 [Daphnia magna]|uniref:Uncharacterized protein n=1 Tax=Daphnia magna TaxID=35525 RepID=A0A164S7U3_9CRUS|nr:Uncharacterized protein APZ42_026480 [Daphnia magna]
MELYMVFDSTTGIKMIFTKRTQFQNVFEPIMAVVEQACNTSNQMERFQPRRTGTHSLWLSFDRFLKYLWRNTTVHHPSRG